MAGALADELRVRRALLLAYHFPPAGGAGVQRSLKFARYLGDFGYDPVVVAGPAGPPTRWTPRDNTLADEIPPGLEVRRIPGPAPSVDAGRQSRARRWLTRRTPFARWWLEGALAAGRAAGRGVDIVYASMSPYESGVVAARLARELGAPWVADLRDPWALDEMAVYPTGAHRRSELASMRSVLATADAVVLNCAEAERVVRERFPELARRLLLTIPNGFDATDFSGPPPHRDDAVFRIVHAGSLHTDLGESRRRTARRRRVLGGGAAVDVLPRSHVYLVEAIERLVAADPRTASSLELHFAGVLTERDRELMRPELVRVHGFLSHRRAVELMRSADLLFLPMHDLPAGTRARAVPGKTYEYLASGRPVLAAVPDGDARDLLARFDGVSLCRPADVVGIREVVARQVERFGRDGRAADRPTDGLAPYERRQLTRRLAGVFDAVAPRGTGSVTADARVDLVRS